MRKAKERKRIQIKEKRNKRMRRTRADIRGEEALESEAKKREGEVLTVEVQEKRMQEYEKQELNEKNKLEEIG